jgi:hypothetical protein
MPADYQLCRIVRRTRTTLGKTLSSSVPDRHVKRFRLTCRRPAPYFAKRGLLWNGELSMRLILVALLCLVPTHAVADTLLLSLQLDRHEFYAFDRGPLPGSPGPELVDPYFSFGFASPRVYWSENYGPDELGSYDAPTSFLDSVNAFLSAADSSPQVFIGNGVNPEEYFQLADRWLPDGDFNDYQITRVQRGVNDVTFVNVGGAISLKTSQTIDVWGVVPEPASGALALMASLGATLLRLTPRK